MTNNNGFWIWWLDLLALLYNCSQLLQLAVSHQPNPSWLPRSLFIQLLILRLSAKVKVRIRVKVRVSLRLAVYRQSVRLAVRRLEIHDQKLFSNWTLAVIVLSDEHMRLSLMNIVTCYLVTRQVLVGSGFCARFTGYTPGGIYSYLLQSQSYCNHTALILHRLTSYFLVCS
jgi:hypothetical protein